jgi:bifunctional DNase/RNase
VIASTDTGLVEMRVSKVVALGPGRGEDISHFVVLDEAQGDRHVVILIGPSEALELQASLQGLPWGRPMTYQFAAALVRSLGGRLREVRLDRVIEGAYAATVEVEGPHGVALVDARCSDALNLAVLMDARIFAAPDVLADCTGRQEGDSAEAGVLQRALTAGPMTISPVEG